MEFEIQRRLYLCCYDITDSRARRSVLRIVATYSSGGQKSAYECYLSYAERHTLLALTSSYLDECDCLVLQPLNPSSDIKTFGIASKPVNVGFLFLG